MNLNVLVAEARTALASRGDVVGNSATSSPRFELFHAANSICSQKVRAVLAQLDLAYVSHPVNLFTGQTYQPAYVRLRMVGCASLGGPLVSRHSGSTAASLGCDGAVVPTLVDREAGAVIVDSQAICRYLDHLASPASRLHPPELAVAIDRELKAVDHLPNYQMLMSRNAEAPGGAAGFSQRKVAWCDHYLAECADEPELVAAYTAKRAKELSAATDLFSHEAIASANARVDQALQKLEAQLSAWHTTFLLTDQPTLADLFWGIELLRIADLGSDHLWTHDRLPEIATYFAKIAALPALRSAVLDWPGALFARAGD